MEIFERETWPIGIAGRSFVFVEQTGEELTTLARRYCEVTNSTLVRLFQESFSSFSEAFEITEEELDKYFAWLLGLATDEEVAADWVRANVPESFRERLLAGVQKLNRLEARTGNVERLLRATGRLAGPPSSTPLASATPADPDSGGPTTPPEKSSTGPESPAAESG